MRRSLIKLSGLVKYVRNGHTGFKSDISCYNCSIMAKNMFLANYGEYGNLSIYLPLKRVNASKVTQF